MNHTGRGKHAREAPAQEQPFSLLTQDDHRQRLVMAFAAALALEMVLAQLVPWRTTTIPPEQPEIITIAKLVRIERKPTPSPKPIVHAHVVAPTNVQPTVVNPGRPSENQHIRRVASARPMVHTKYHKAVALVHIPTGGQGAGAGKSKALTGGVGTGGTERPRDSVLRVQRSSRPTRGRGDVGDIRISPLSAAAIDQDSPARGGNARHDQARADRAHWRRARAPRGDVAGGGIGRHRGNTAGERRRRRTVIMATCRHRRRCRASCPRRFGQRQRRHGHGDARGGSFGARSGAVVVRAPATG